MDTCSNCFTDSNGVLYCQCPYGSSFTFTKLQNSYACSGSIGVVAGELVCNFVAGNYGISCKQCSMNYKYTLECSCANENGVYGLTFLASATTCVYAENINGILTCTSRTLSPTTKAPTPQPSSSVQCTWSSQTINGEATPSSPCSSKTSLQGCEYNNYCCWNYGSSTCQPVPGCPNCLALSAQSCSSAPSGCCTFNTGLQQCVRVCPYGETNVGMCPGNTGS